MKKKKKTETLDLTPQHLERIKALSPSRVRSPEDLSAWSNMNNWETDRWPQQPGRYQWLSHVEKNMSDPNWPLFEYEINPQGFRGTWPNQDAQDLTLLLGCSFTFGEGLDKPDTFWGILDGRLSGVINLGVPGAGHSQIAELFWAASRAWRGATRALITWPNMTRFHYINSEHKIWPIHPHQDHAASPEFVGVWNGFWNHWSTTNIWHSFARSVELAEAIAESRGIHLHHGTWGGTEPQTIIRSVTGKEPIPFAYAQLGETPEVARDGHHPGRKQNREYANLALEQL